jgi:hypothetical protein
MEIIAIREIYNVSVIVGSVSEGQITQSPTVRVGQVMTKRFVV